MQSSKHWMLREMIEYGHKMEEKVKAMQSEIKENVQGINREGKEFIYFCYFFSFLAREHN